ncbi:MAG: GDSL-type esterase/lipase family protein [Sphingomicrobium sp.]
MLSRRLLIQSGLAAPLAFSAAPASAETLRQQCEREILPTLDFPNLARYRADNARLMAANAPVDVVFLGDSITEGWKDKRPAFFSPRRVGRGIGGQTTPQMVLRMMADVVDLKPRLMHLMAGTNDVAGNTGPMTAGMTQANVRMISDIARAHGIGVLLASIPPAGAFPWRPGLETRAPIAALNRWLRRFAAISGAIFIDYDRVLDDGTGAMRPGLAYDGVHPTEAGYDAMARLVEPILRRALGRNNRA